MRLTPLDIRKQEFKKAMRGLDPEEVYAFLTTIADEYEAVLNDNKALRERLLELDDKVQEYRNMEKTLRDTLLTAERATSEAKDNARREAELIVKQAEIDAEKGVRDIKESAMKLRQEIQSLRRQRDSFLTRMKMLAESHMKFLETSEDDFREDDDRVAEAERRVGERLGNTSSISRAPENRTPQAPRPAPGAAPAPKPQTPGQANPGATPGAAPGRVSDRKTGEALGDSGNTMTLSEDEAPLRSLLDEVLEGQRAVLDEISNRDGMEERPKLAEQKLPGRAEKATARKGGDGWSLERLREDILGDSNLGDETD